MDISKAKIGMKFKNLKTRKDFRIEGNKYKIIGLQRNNGYITGIEYTCEKGFTRCTRSLDEIELLDDYEIHLKRINNELMRIKNV